MEAKIKMPTHEEAAMVMKRIREAFAAEKVELQALDELKPNGIRAQGAATKEQKMRIVSDLFGSGIVMIDLGPSAYAFAVRR